MYAIWVALAVVGALVIPAVVLLGIGDFVRRRKRLGPERRFAAVVHVAAVFAALLGVGEAWLAFASDHPLKWRSLAAPFVMVGLVYFFAFLMGGPLGAPGAQWAAYLREKLKR